MGYRLEGKKECKSVVYSMKKNWFFIPVYSPYRSLPYPPQDEINVLIDRLINTLQQKNCKDKYHIGQILYPLLEYIEKYPEKKAVIQQLANEKKIFFGPFYIQLHAGHTSGESMIRNLLIGRKEGNQIGDTLKTGYLPMMRGRNSQVPQILAGFNIDAVIISTDIQFFNKNTQEFIWEGADGSKLLVGRAVFLTDQQFNIPKTQLKEHLNAYCKTDGDNLVVYQFQNVDELENLHSRVDTIASISHSEVIIESLSECIWNIKDTIDLKEISVYKGEICLENMDDNAQNQLEYFLRHSVEIGVINHRLSNLIQYLIEPWSVITKLLKVNTDTVLIEQLWAQLLRNQTFVYLESDQTDQFIHTLYTELTLLMEQAERQLNEIIHSIVDNIRIEEPLNRNFYFTIINPLPFSRTEIAEITLEMPAIINRDTIVAKEIGGREIPFRIINKEEGAIFRLNNQDKAKYRCLVELKNIPGMGWKTFQVDLNGRPKFFPSVSISAERNALENDYLRVEINDNGTLEVFAKETGEFFTEVGYFQDEVDLGQYSAEDKTSTHIPLNTKKLRPQIKLLYNTPKAAAYKIDYFWDIPGMFIWNNSRRSPKHVRIVISEIVTLNRLSRQIDLQVSIHDHAYDHMIKMCFPIEFIPTNTYTSGFFSVETRPFDIPKAKRCHGFSMKNFVGVSNEEGGFAVLSDSLTEYQLVKGKHSQLELTLVRNFSINKTDIYVDSKTQRNEKINIHLAFYPHLADWESGEILNEGLTFNMPLIVHQLEKKDGLLPAKMQFLRVSPDILLYSTLKPSDDNNSVILRLYNPTRNLIDGEIITCFPIKAARLLTLEELIITPIDPIDINRLNIKISPKKIVTIKIIFTGVIDLQNIIL